MYRITFAIRRLDCTLFLLPCVYLSLSYGWKSGWWKLPWRFLRQLAVLVLSVAARLVVQGRARMALCQL